MHKHPDADSFVRAYLERPTDATTRLVFADWLEETGLPHNAAWAHYIRLRDESERHPAASRERRELLRQADDHAPRIHAKLTMSAARFVGYPKSLLQLLPAANIAVRLANFEVDRHALAFITESVARNARLIPLNAQNLTFLVAAVDPTELEVAKRLSWIVGRGVVLVGADAEDIQAAFERHYWPVADEPVV